MLEPLPEPELRQHVAKARLQPESDARDAQIYRAVRRIIDGGSVFYVLADTPSQREDFLSVLVDDKTVVDFELARNDPEALPTDVKQYSVEDWRKDIDAVTKAKLRIALELVRKELRR